MINHKSKEFSKASTILTKYDFVERMTQNSKYLKEEFQDYGVRISHQLHDPKHKALYIKLAKDLPRGLMEQALTFTLDYPTQDVNKGRLYMWKLNELCNKKGIKIPSNKRKKTSKLKSKKTQQLPLIK